MTIETRVGYAATTVLETICMIEIAWSYTQKDYSTMLEYINKYQTLKNYNGGQDGTNKN